MSMKSSQFQGIATFNPATADDLEKYLNEKETLVVKKILDSFIPPIITSDLSLNFSKLPFLFEKVKKPERILTSVDTHNSVNKINEAFWEHLELVEAFITEFFQQLDLESVDSWSTELMVIVERIKCTLFSNLTSLSKALYDVENQLESFFHYSSHESFLKKIIFFWKKNLDSSLFSYVDKCKKFLEFRYQSFSDRFERYVIFQAKVNQAAAKFEKYEVFSLLENEAKEKCLKIYRLVKFWELNTKIKSLPQRETIRSLRGLITPDKALTYFNLYYEELQKAMYGLSRMIKLYQGVVNSQVYLAKLNGFKKELHALGATVAKYRDFLIRTDPNPYVRSRIGFAEWVMGPEPVEGKEMLHLSYDIESLDSVLDGFILSLSKKTSSQEKDTQETRSEISCLLHEMGQPLISKPMMKVRANHLVNLIEQMDELTSYSMGDVEFIEQAFIKGLRGDWKYQVMYDIPKFHKLYHIHQGIMGDIKQPQHLVRLKKFKHYLQQIEQWIQKNKTTAHSEEIAFHLSDIKNYLQNFFAQAQQVVQAEGDPALIQKDVRSIEHQLLDYRYQFGRFFHHLNAHYPDEKLLRQQFLFVDQYFEAIEMKINEFYSADLQNKTSKFIR